MRISDITCHKASEKLVRIRRFVRFSKRKLNGIETIRYLIVEPIKIMVYYSGEKKPSPCRFCEAHPLPQGEGLQAKLNHLENMIQYRIKKRRGRDCLEGI